jgi:hypothetical protein
MLCAKDLKESDMLEKFQETLKLETRNPQPGTN